MHVRWNKAWRIVTGKSDWKHKSAKRSGCSFSHLLQLLSAFIHLLIRSLSHLTHLLFSYSLTGWTFHKIIWQSLNYDTTVTNFRTVGISVFISKFAKSNCMTVQVSTYHFSNTIGKTDYSSYGHLPYVFLFNCILVIDYTN